MLCHLGSAHTIGGALEPKRSYLVTDLKRRTTCSLSEPEELMNYSSGKEFCIARKFVATCNFFHYPSLSQKGLYYFSLKLKNIFVVCLIDSVR